MHAREGALFKRKLTDAFVRALTTPGKHADGEVPGLYLEVSASRKIGNPPSKFWRLKYRLHGKENRFSIGSYPDIGLKEAREIARSARRDVANGIAPLKAKTAKIEAQRLSEQRTFAYVAEQWMTFKSAHLVSKSIAGFRGALRNHILPAVGSKPVSEISLNTSPPSSRHCASNVSWLWPAVYAQSSVPSSASLKAAAGWSATWRSAMSRS
jgi:hypothetical protein